MHVLYVHQNFPAQFGHVARHLARGLRWRCTFISETPAGVVEGIEKIQYRIEGCATKATHFCSRTFENATWHADAVFKALKARPDIRPDLIVGHSGFGSTLFLTELYGDVPIINFFEFYYRAHGPDSDMDFRKDLGWSVPEIKYLRSYARNAMILLDLQNCRRAYTPTHFQKSRFPTEYQDKLRVIFDGVDRAIYHGYGETLRPLPADRPTRTLAGVSVPASTRVVTYVSRGFESMRGFDLFVRTAKLILRENPDVLFFIVGTDRVAYGGDEAYLPAGQTFKQWALARESGGGGGSGRESGGAGGVDESRLKFIGRLPPPELGRLLAVTDLHLYWTVPFVLSWSLMDALSCGAVVLASATTPVKEMIEDGVNGLLADFFSPEEFAAKAIAVLKDPAAYRPLGREAERRIVEQYSLEAVVPKMLELYEQATEGRTLSTDGPVSGPPPAPVACGSPGSRRFSGEFLFYTVSK